MNNYGLILKQLRQLNRLTLKSTAKLIGKSVGWFSEVENGRGQSRLSEKEFERIVLLLHGDKHRELFKTWVALAKIKNRADRSLDGPVLKHVRKKKHLSLVEASQLVGISKRYLSNLENGHRSVKLEMRNRIMKAYGYNQTSFRNFTSDDKRAGSVPVRYKIGVLLNQIEEENLLKIFNFIIDEVPRKKGPLDFLDASNFPTTNREVKV